MVFWNGDFPSRLFSEFFKTVLFSEKQCLQTFFEWLLQHISYSFRAAISLEQLLFWGAPFSNESFPCISYFFRIPNFLEPNFYQAATSSNIGSSLRQLLFGKATILAEELLRIKISTEELLCRSRNNEAQHQLYQESLFFEKTKFLENEYFAFSIFSGELHFRETTFSKRITQLPFQKSYFLTTYFFRRAATLQISFFSTATLTIYQLVIKWVQYELRTLKLWEFFLVYLLFLKVASETNLYNSLATQSTAELVFSGETTFWAM